MKKILAILFLSFFLPGNLSAYNYKNNFFTLTNGYLKMVIVNMSKKLKVNFARQNQSIAIIGIIINVISLSIKIILILKLIPTDGGFYISLIQVGTH